MVCGVPPEAQCAHCGALTLDDAGLRVASCRNCGHCAHPATREDGRRTLCVACGAVLAVASVAVTEDDGEAD